MEIRYLSGLIAVHLRFIATACLIAAFGALSVTYLLPETYQASTTILIRPRRQVEFTPAQQNMLGFPLSVTSPPETISQTYASMMTSTAVAMRVVKVLALDAPAPEQAGTWYSRPFRWARHTLRDTVGNTWDFVRYGRVEKQDAYSAAVARVRNQLEAAPVKGTYLFALTATWDDPQMAARIANTAAEVFSKHAEEARRAEGDASLPFFEAQVDALRGELHAARDRLAQYRASNNVSSLGEQMTVNIKTLAELEANYAEAINQSAEAQAALVELDQLLAREPAELHVSGTTVGNPVVESLKQQLARDQVRLAALQETLTPAHPDVRELSASMDAARQRIAAESARMNASDTTELNPFYKALKQQRLDRSVAARSIDARAKSLNASIAQYRAQGTSLSSHRGELSRLELETEVLEDQYRLLASKSEEARLVATQATSDLRALAPAVAPLYPTGPIRLFYAVGGFLLGLIGSLFVVLVTDYTNPRVRTVEAVARLLGAPTLAQIPGMNGSRSGTDLLSDAAVEEGMIARIAARDSSRRAAS